MPSKSNTPPADGDDEPKTAKPRARAKAKAKTPEATPRADPKAKPGLSQVPGITLGSRLQRTRMKAGLSIRELADRSGVNKDTIVKLEHGHTPSYRTLCRVCDGLGVTVVQLLKPELDDDASDAPVAVHARKTETRVGLRTLRDEQAKVRGVGQRQVLAADEAVRLSWLACRLRGGQMNSWLLELRGETEPTTHAGEEFVFCLKGSATVTVAGVPYDLDEGDAATFWSAEPHSYAPSARALKAGDLPVLVLSVWISHVDRPEK